MSVFAPPGLNRAVHQGFAAGGHYAIAPVVLAAGVAIAAANTLYLLPFIADDATVPWKALALRVTTAGSGGAAVKFGIWGRGAGIAEPRGTPLAVSAGTAAETINAMCRGNFAADFLPRVGSLYFAGFLGTGTQPSCIGYVNTSSHFSRLIGAQPASSTGGMQNGWSIAKTYADDLAAFNITGGLSALLGAAPLPYIGT